MSVNSGTHFKQLVLVCFGFFNFNNMNEIWKEVPGYEGCYDVSNLGRVKRISKIINGKYYLSDKILKGSINSNGYLMIQLNNNGQIKHYYIHQLVAMSFLNHKPNKLKLVVNHKDFNKLNNNVCNLEIITQRKNTNRSHLKSSSDYVGVSWSKEKNKWRSQIKIKGKTIVLGYYKSEFIAHISYQLQLSKT